MFVSIFFNKFFGNKSVQTKKKTCFPPTNIYVPWVPVCMVGYGSIATVMVPTKKTYWMANVYSVSVWQNTFVLVQHSPFSIPSYPHSIIHI